METASWPKIRERTKQVKDRTYSYWTIDLGVVDGVRKFRNFTSLEEAELQAERLRRARNRLGRDALRLTEDQKKGAVQALKKLGGHATLADAADFFMRHQTPDGERKTVSELFADYMESKEQAGRRQRSIQDLRYRIGRFVKSFGEQHIHEITPHDLENWLNTCGYHGASRRNFKTVLVGFFGFALKRGLLIRNTATAIEKPTVDEKIPDILSCDEVEKLLQTTLALEPAMIPYFAIAVFAGIRPAEIEQLDWSSIQFDDAMTIRITPKTAKKRRLRLVDISPNLREWLLPHRQPAGPVHYSRREFDRIRVKSGVRWVPDILRHTFASYHLAKHENAARTSLQMGHRDLDVLFNHYRNLVTREQADKFWSITPDTIHQQNK